MANNILSNFPRKTANVIINHVQRRHMPVNVPPTATGKRRFRLAVETDPHKLVNYCCGLNYHIDEPPVKLKPDNEYPDWLWKLRLGPKPNSWEMEKGTKEYYLRLAEEGKQRNYLLKMKTPRPSKVVGKVLKELDEYVHHIRFNALAHLEDDVGLKSNSLEIDWFANSRNIVHASEYYLPRNENKVMYKDKIEGNQFTKNWSDECKYSSFVSRQKSIHPRRPVHLKAIQDSKQRHRYATT